VKKIFIHSYLTYLLSLLIVLLLIFFHFRGIIYYDEGYILNSALRITHGQIPYRDFDMVYTPLSFLGTAFFFHLFGASVFSGRLTALVVSLFSVFAIYKIVIKLTGNKLYTFLSIFFFIAWGPTHINFPWPTMFALCLTLYALLFYQKAIQEKNPKHFFWMGVMAVLIFFSKQNFGAGMIILFLIPVIFLRVKRLYSILYYIAGLSAITIIALTLMLVTHSFIPFLNNLYVYTFMKIIAEKTIDTPFLYDGTIVVRILKFFFYLSPLIFAGCAFYMTIKKKKQSLLIIPITVAVIYLLGIRPVTDYDHLGPLLAISGMTFPILFLLIENNMLKKFIFFGCIGMVLLGFYTAYFSGYYKWETPLEYNTIFATNPRLHIFMTQETLTKSAQLKQYIDSYTKPNEPIFINYYSPFIYFLADRPDASRYDYISPTAIPLFYQQNTIAILQKKHVRLILALGENEQSPIANYIRKNYHLTKKISDYDIYTR